MYLEDPWPTMPDGTDFDGKHLLSLFRAGKSPFESAWDVNQLIQELEGSLGATVTDIPFVYRGSNNYVSFEHLEMRQRLKAPGLPCQAFKWPGYCGALGTW